MNARYNLTYVTQPFIMDHAGVFPRMIASGLALACVTISPEGGTVAESQKVRMSLQDLKVKSFATTPSLQRDEGTVRGLDTCGDCTVTTNDAGCLPCTITTNDCYGQTCGDTCGQTAMGGTGGTGCGQQSYTGGCGGMSDGCGAYHTQGCNHYSGSQNCCDWGALTGL